MPTLQEVWTKDTMELYEIVFHWGSKYSRGSEHTVDNRKFPLEMQLFHFNKYFDNYKEHPHGITAMAVLFEIQAEDNPALDPLVDSLMSILQENDYTDDVRAFSIGSILPANLNDYYRYWGSFTTPPCNENVMWIVFEHTVPISARQLNRF